jgi:hypothetical protein
MAAFHVTRTQFEAALTALGLDPKRVVSVNLREDWVYIERTNAGAISQAVVDDSGDEGTAA